MSSRTSLRLARSLLLGTRSMQYHPLGRPGRHTGDVPWRPRRRGQGSSDRHHLPSAAPGWTCPHHPRTHRLQGGRMKTLTYQENGPLRRTDRCDRGCRLLHSLPPRCSTRDISDPRHPPFLRTVDVLLPVVPQPPLRRHHHRRARRHDRRHRRAVGQPAGSGHRSCQHSSSAAAGEHGRPEFSPSGWSKPPLSIRLRMLSIARPDCSPAVAYRTAFWTFMSAFTYRQKTLTVEIVHRTSSSSLAFFFIYRYKLPLTISRRRSWCVSWYSLRYCTVS